MTQDSREKRLDSVLNMNRRSFMKTAAAGAATTAVAGMVELKTAKEAKAFAYEPYPRDDQLTTVVTSCAHNCGSRHMLVAHKQGDVIVRLSTDDGRFQKNGAFGKDTDEEPQLRACLRGRSYRSRLYSPERLLYPMMRVGERGEGKFKRVSWDEALNFVASKMLAIKQQYGPQALLDQSYAGASYGVLHKSDQIEGLLGRFLGMFGCRTNSWSVPSYQGTTTSSRWTYGTIEDGNEDDAFAHSKLIIMWGWNPAYTFHGGNTFYYMRKAKQNGCKFVVIDPQYTDSASAYDAWWIPINPNTDAAMMAGMAHYIFDNNLHDQEFIDKFTQGMDEGTMPEWAKNSPNGTENFKDYILGKYDGTPKTPEWAAEVCGVSAEDIKKLAHMYATTKPAALKASWAPGRNAYGEQYNRMAAALQAMTGNIGILGGCAEGVGKGWHAEAVAYPYDQYANVWYASIKSDRWAHIVLNYPNVSREEAGLWPRNDQLDGVVPNIRGIFWQGSDWFNQLTNINKEIQAIKKLDLVVCMDSTITPSGLFADVLLPVATHFERHDAALPWYKGHYYIHRPKVIEPLGESRTDMQIFTELAYRIGDLNPQGYGMFGKTYNPKANRDYWINPDPVDESYLSDWWHNKVMHHQHVDMSWEEFKQRGVYKFTFDKPHVAFREQIENGKPFQTASGKIEILSSELAKISDWKRTRYGYHVPSIPKWIEPWEWLNSPKTKDFPYHMISPHPRWRTHSIFHNIPWLRETYEQEITINAADARKLDIKNGDIVEAWNDRGKVVMPAYVTERCMPGVVVLHEGAWLDVDENGVDRSGNPDFLTLDEPSPAGAFAYNTVLCNIKKSDLTHRPGWDKLATARSHVFRRDL
ncbi:MAG: molybdopterin oxidoreductase [Candidatus Sedimenticola endophacoides]|uniref:Molybdopterin oxidoreductase n=1 Tax=Candidatus Sedimenticola endophacoides TaxID=2548426 RepID=A0A657PID8_9GAMM|nr:MAG: molybdopterin oxidoreductase [Candidatus Sedimenticola endophacoides]OQX36083.1 MAG: molybdopterin oxidoreductase [Candidatus Sedimenticola endophacoides]OQX40776.1 MAG: molybdopterin oxidoreductase [Candidatus Sedimenticola endophacoides]OQX48621.1 MAG: molybdopterin oxidoreductase [Candidatus Sedimenticola endophacoides]PUE00649.1 MAG: molybdopterin oxidoreductase [Candidatus Sedimenticola endophacoides]